MLGTIVFWIARSIIIFTKGNYMWNQKIVKLFQVLKEIKNRQIFGI
jgi:hypothetical protein